MGMTILILVLLIATFWVIARFVLAGPDMAAYDMPQHAPVRTSVSAEHQHVAAAVAGMVGAAAGLRGRERLAKMRATLEALGDRADLDGIEIRPANANGIAAEWVLADGHSTRERLLYIHGGAFSLGSPRSHRTVTTELARRTGLAVLAIDYRLLPEHTRRDAFDDCRIAWDWLADHGPNGIEDAGSLFVAGDSAGGNLTLVLLQWLRDRQRAGRPPRQADGAIALSPLTDGTFASPSIRGNIGQDPMLGPMARAIVRIPRPLLLWATALRNRMLPRDPRLSPLYGDLADLPPTLVQVSEAEILIDDARRYVNRVLAAGSPATLETWPAMVHVWHVFGPELPEADEAFARIAGFVARVRQPAGAASTASQAP
jgi:epsilon-lactone hydrolase